MSIVRIIFESHGPPTSLPAICSQLRGSTSYDCELVSLPYLNARIPQIRINTHPCIALQLEDDPEIIVEEIQEMVTEAEEEYHFDEDQLGRMRRCSAAIDLYTCSPMRIDHLPAGGMLFSTPNDVDPRAPEIRAVIALLTRILSGWAYDNLNGGWFENDERS
jgi:hypothetical protein